MRFLKSIPARIKSLWQRKIAPKLHRPTKEGLKTFLRAYGPRVLIFLVIFCVALGAIYVFGVSEDDYHVRSVTISSTGIPEKFDGFKIVYFSDIHIQDKDDVARLKKIVKTINAQDAEMVLFGGDLYEGKIIKSAKVQSCLKDIQTTYGKFAILGNEDLDDKKQVTSLLNEGGFEVLSNSVRKIYYKNKKIRLIGYSTKKPKTKKSSRLWTIGLSHYPDVFDDTYETEDIHLAGHSGGGYIWLPLYGAVYTDDHTKTYNHGKYTKGSATLYVTNGVSTSDTCAYKLFARNEVMVFTLKHTDETTTTTTTESSSPDTSSSASS